MKTYTYKKRLVRGLKNTYYLFVYDEFGFWRNTIYDLDGRIIRLKIKELKSFYNTNERGYNS